MRVSAPNTDTGKMPVDMEWAFQLAAKTVLQIARRQSNPQRKKRPQRITVNDMIIGMVSGERPGQAHFGPHETPVIAASRMAPEENSGRVIASSATLGNTANRISGRQQNV